MLDDERVREESERSSQTGNASPDLEKQSKNDLSSALDASKNEDERMASLKRVFKKAFIYSTIFTAIVIIIGMSFHARMLLCQRSVSALADVFLALCVQSEVLHVLDCVLDVRSVCLSSTLHGRSVNLDGTVSGSLRAERFALYYHCGSLARRW